MQAEKKASPTTKRDEEASHLKPGNDSSVIGTIVEEQDSFDKTQTLMSPSAYLIAASVSLDDHTSDSTTETDDVASRSATLTIPRSLLQALSFPRTDQEAPITTLNGVTQVIVSIRLNDQTHIISEASHDSPINLGDTTSIRPSAKDEQRVDPTRLSNTFGKQPSPIVVQKGASSSKQMLLSKLHESAMFAVYFAAKFNPNFLISVLPM
jgi:hypothetical protein